MNSTGCGRAGMIDVPEVALAQDIVVHALLELVSQAGRDLLDGLRDLWAS